MTLNVENIFLAGHTHSHKPHHPNTPVHPMLRSRLRAHRSSLFISVEGFVVFIHRTIELERAI